MSRYLERLQPLRALLEMLANATLVVALVLAGIVWIRHTQTPFSAKTAQSSSEASGYSLIGRHLALPGIPWGPHGGTLQFG